MPRIPSFQPCRHTLESIQHTAAIMCDQYKDTRFSDELRCHRYRERKCADTIGTVLVH